MAELEYQSKGLHWVRNVQTGACEMHRISSVGMMGCKRVHRDIEHSVEMSRTCSTFEVFSTLLLR